MMICNNSMPRMVLEKAQTKDHIITERRERNVAAQQIATMAATSKCSMGRESNGIVCHLLTESNFRLPLPAASFCEQGLAFKVVLLNGSAELGLH